MTLWHSHENGMKFDPHSSLINVDWLCGWHANAIRMVLTACICIYVGMWIHCNTSHHYAIIFTSIRNRISDDII